MSGEAQPKLLAVIRNGDELVAAFRKRVAVMDISHESLDEISGVAPGYSGKVLAVPPIRGFGPMSFWSIAGGLGVSLALVEDPTNKPRQIPKRRMQRGSSRHWRYVEALTKALGTIRKQAVEQGSIGGRKRFENMTDDEKADHQSRAAKARWRAYRRAVRERAQESARLASRSPGLVKRDRERGSTKCKS